MVRQAVPSGGHSSAASEPLTRAPDFSFPSMRKSLFAPAPLFWHFSFALHSTFSSYSIYPDLVPSVSVVSFTSWFFRNNFGVQLFQECGLWQISLSFALHTNAESCIIQPCISKFSSALILGLEVPPLITASVIGTDTLVSTEICITELLDFYLLPVRSH